MTTVNKKTRWRRPQIDLLLAHFPNALDLNYKVPTRNEILNFIGKTEDQILKNRKEPQIRSWIHKQRDQLKQKSDVPQRNHVPTYIYAKFDKFIRAKKVPSGETCGKFLARSPSKANVTINNIQEWVRLAIRRKSIEM